MNDDAPLVISQRPVDRGPDRVRTDAPRLVYLATLCMAAAVLVWLMGGQSATAATQDDHVTVIVQVGDHDVFVRSADVPGTVSGLEALQLSGLEIVTAPTSFGPALCAIAGTGCPADDCFCGDGAWTYQFWDGASWQIHATGPAGSSLAAGSIEGYRWSPIWGDAPLPAPRLMAAASALEWLAPRQSAENGSYGDSAAASIEALMAVGANQWMAADWRLDGVSPPLGAFLMGAAPEYANKGPAYAGKVAVAAAAGDLCLPPSVTAPAGYYTPGVGYDVDAGFAAWAMLGAASLSEPIPADAVTALEGMAFPTGGWEWQHGFGVDTNTTALAIQALVAAGQPTTTAAIQSGIAFLATAQNEDGGFTYDPAAIYTTDSDTNSTAYVVQALIAAGEDPLGQRWTKGGATPIDYLLARQQADGSLEWQPGSGPNQLATQQAVPALLGEPFPLAITSPRRCAVLGLPALSSHQP